MRHVEPEVFLVARPQLDVVELHRYLEEVDGKEWAYRQPFLTKEQNDGELLVEAGGRLCYRSWKEGLNPNVRRVRTDSKEYLGNILSSKHGSVIEHANYTFIFHNVSRVFTHELVRHRAGVAYSQESMRFVRLTDIPFWFPEWAREDEELMQRSVAVLTMLEEHQNWMGTRFGLDDEGVPFAEKKHKTSFMRRFAPDGVATGIMATANIRTLRHVIYMRTALGAEEEIRLVFDKVAEVMKDELPNLMQDFDPNEDREWVPKFVKV